ncbi:MAG: formate dehydrogenase accessory sulfurtransferase FdhD [Burkholderiaceae bacterium]|jgi:FdhD protein|nr:formate dehydrogenase accessory sulfurtransferase FdhD [Burkholderiaceae bacterium]
MKTPAATAITANCVVTQWRNNRAGIEMAQIAEEVPIALEYNGIAHVVMLATPADLLDFAWGFSMTEGIVRTPADIYDCEILTGEAGIRVTLQIASEAFMNMKEKRRRLAGRTGCGLCGMESLQQLHTPAPVNSTARVTWAQLQNAMQDMETKQVLRAQTGATHAAAWMKRDGTVSTVREDVGRHNALDKLIGALWQQQEELSSGSILVSSRASYEMVQKCAAAGAGVLAAVSSPTAMAIRMAAAANITLIGFVRRNGCAVYTHTNRFDGNPPD